MEITDQQVQEHKAENSELKDQTEKTRIETPVLDAEAKPRPETPVLHVEAKPRCETPLIEKFKPVVMLTDQTTISDRETWRSLKKLT